MKSAIARVGSFGQRLSRVLLDLGFVDDDTLAEAYSMLFKMPVTHLGAVHRDAHALARLDVAFCEQHGCFPLALKDRQLTLAMVDPTELDVLDEVKSRTGLRVVPLLSSELEVTRAISKHYLGRDLPMPTNRARKAVTREVTEDDVKPLELDSRRPPEAIVTGEAPVDLEQRLAAAKANQEKTATILRAVEQLLKEKGWLP